MPASTTTIASAVRPPHPEQSYGTTWHDVQSALATYSHDLRITGQGIKPTASRRTLEIALEDIGDLEQKLAILRDLATENLAAI